jgi:hypothetical protein
MRTIRPITNEEIAALAAEPQIPVFFGDAVRMLPARIVSRMMSVDGCWRVSGWNSGNGFAKVSILGKSRQVHRVIYTLIVGPIPDGDVLDHKKHSGCRFRDCGNPDHLEPVSVKVNTHRGAATLFAPTASP